MNIQIEFKVSKVRPDIGKTFPLLTTATRMIWNKYGESKQKTGISQGTKKPRACSKAAGLTCSGSVAIVPAPSTTSDRRYDK